MDSNYTPEQLERLAAAREVEVNGGRLLADAVVRISYAFETVCKELLAQLKAEAEGRKG